MLEERHCRNGSTLVGFDDDIEGVVHSLRVRARLTDGGRLSLGVIGVGDWTLTAAGRSVDLALRLAGTGMVEEILDPPRAVEEFDVPPATSSRRRWRSGRAAATARARVPRASSARSGSSRRERHEIPTS